MEEEKSFFIIKPDSLNFKNDIINELIFYNFTLSFVQEIILIESFLEQLYNTGGDEIVNKCNVRYLAGKRAVSGIVSGIDCISRLIRLCGENYIPDKCSPISLRYKYSPIRKPIIINNIEFYVNSIHRSMPKDAQREVSLYLSAYKEQLF